MLPCRRFVGVLTDADARLGVDAVRYSFIVMDLHHLLLAGLPAHSAIPPIATSERTCREVWLVPKPEVASVYSIASVACVSSDSGKVRLRAFAVLRLITSSYLV